jgi:DNA-binding NarL/FixJ family response regulator
MAVRVLIVDDHARFRALARLLLVADGFDVVGEAGDGAQALVAARALHPDVVLLDVQLPDEDGFAVAGTLAARRPAPAVVLVSSRSLQPRHLPTVVPEPEDGGGLRALGVHQARADRDNRRVLAVLTFLRS